MKTALITNIVYVNKKRKFQEELIGLPLPKHHCFERIINSEFDSPSNQSPENEGFQTCMIHEDTEREMSDNGSGYESAKDSNSFVTYSDSATSVYGEAKCNPDFVKTSVYDQPSTSSGNCGSSSFQNTLYSLDSRIVTNMGAGKEELTFMSIGHPHHKKGKSQEYHNLEEHLLEFQDLIDYPCSDYELDGMEQCKDKDLEDMPYSNEMNPNVFVLSSGRWSVDRGNSVVWKFYALRIDDQHLSMLCHCICICMPPLFFSSFVSYI